MPEVPSGAGGGSRVRLGSSVAHAARVRNCLEEPDSLIGRDRETDEVCGLVEASRAVTLCGPGGIGKTRLARRVLTVIAGQFPDGVYLAELGDLRQPDLVASRVAAAAGVIEEPGRPAAETLAAALAERRVLIALDSCEHLVDGCAALCSDLLARCSGLRILATSQEPLRIAAETVWQVPPLPIPPVAATVEEICSCAAVRLFAYRAAASSDGFRLDAGSAAAVAELCRTLDGVPLAIELAAALTRTLPLAQIRDHLADRPGQQADGYRTAPPRQQTLRAAIEWGYDLLTPAERVLLRRLSVFASWSLEMAEQVCPGDGIGAGEVLGLLTGLVDKSLVLPEPPVNGQARYRMLDTVRGYASWQLAGAGESVQWQRRFTAYAVRTAERNFAVGMARIPAPWQVRVDTFGQYDAEAANLRQVLGCALAGGDAHTGLRICVAVSPCWVARGTFAEGAAWLDSLLALERSAVPPQVSGAAMIVRAQIASSSDSSAAHTSGAAGLELCRSAGDQFWTATGLNLLAQVALHSARADEAASLAGQAMLAAQAAGDGWNHGYALGIQAAAAARDGKLGHARELAEASASVMAGIDHQWGVARALLGLGDLARHCGDPAGASRHYQQALPALREIGATPEIARCLAGLGRAAMDQGAATWARRYLTESIQLSRSTGARIGIARGLEAFAALAASEHQPERAMRLIAAAAALREAAGHPPLPATRTEPYLTDAARLGDSALTRLWAEGLALSGEQAVTLAVDPAA